MMHTPTLMRSVTGQKRDGETEGSLTRRSRLGCSSGGRESQQRSDVGGSHAHWLDKGTVLEVVEGHFEGCIFGVAGRRLCSRAVRKQSAPEGLARRLTLPVACLSGLLTCERPNERTGSVGWVGSGCDDVSTDLEEVGGVRPTRFHDVRNLEKEQTERGRAWIAERVSGGGLGR